MYTLIVYRYTCVNRNTWWYDLDFILYPFLTKLNISNTLFFLFKENPINCNLSFVDYEIKISFFPAKCSIGATNALIPTFTAIQYPTTMRTLSVGVGNFAAGLALITVPYMWALVWLLYTTNLINFKWNKLIKFIFVPTWRNHTPINITNIILQNRMKFKKIYP